MEPAERASAVAVSGTKILDVGSLEDLERRLKPGSYTVDRRYQDHVIVPGFIEQHLHPLLGAVSLSADIISIEDWNVPGKVSKAALNHDNYVARLKSAVAAMRGRPADELLFTWGYHQYFHGDVYRPQLDAISPDRPIITWHRSCHELILNSAAIKRYGITEASLQGHGLASTQANFAKGHFYEKGLELVLAPVGKALITPARMQTGVSLLKTYLRAKGVTTICEPGTQMSRPIQTFWETSLGGEDTGFRTYFIPDGRALYDKYKANLAELVPATAAFTTWGKGNVAWLPKQEKLFSDGAIFSLLMQVEQPYLDGHKGEWIAEPVDYKAAFKTYWDAGYHIHNHVNGDRGLSVVVETLAQNMTDKPRKNHRFTVVHFAVSTDEQVQKLAALGAIISANPYYLSALADKYSEMGLGPQRANSMVRLGTAVRNNVSISLHSDMPMAPADPLFLMWCAVNRSTVSGRTADPSQRITAEKALRAVTIEAAYSIDLEDSIGSIKPGKIANFTILDNDPLKVDPAKIRDIAVVGTVFDGKPIAAANAGPLTPSETSDVKEHEALLGRDALNSVAG
jgi:predicted amidohydrolase YtcJ